MDPISRRACLAGSASVLAALGLTSVVARPARAATISPDAGADPDFPAQSAQLVREMVGASHGNEARVRELLKQAPRLANASWDWGFGDWETALGAASHVGNRSIASLLIDHGARPDLFTLAMLGHLDALRAAIEAAPGIERTKGPHGITLMRHARAGGEQAATVVEYLASLPGSDLPYESIPLDESARDRYLGNYRYGPGDTEIIEIRYQQKQAVLSLSRAGDSWRGLTHLGDHTFHPVGAPEVRVRFTLNSSIAAGLVITAPMPLAEASRI